MPLLKEEANKKHAPHKKMRAEAIKHMHPGTSFSLFSKSMPLKTSAERACSRACMLKARSKRACTGGCPRACATASHLLLLLLLLWACDTAAGQPAGRHTQTGMALARGCTAHCRCKLAVARAAEARPHCKGGAGGVHTVGRARALQPAAVWAVGGRRACILALQLGFSVTGHALC